MAFSTPDRGLWIVGAAVANLVARVITEKNGEQELAKRFDNITNTFCEAGQVPDGIAVLKASIKAVTRFYEGGDGETFNWKTKDRQELIRFLERRYGRDLDHTLREVIASRVLTAQSMTVHGLSEEDFEYYVVNSALRNSIHIGRPLDRDAQFEPGRYNTRPNDPTLNLPKYLQNA